MLKELHSFLKQKGGLFFGVKGGSGIILIKKDNNQWSAPCAVGIGGISFGFQGGISKVDHIIILSNDEQVNIFMGKGQLQLKTNAEASILKYGRQGNVGVNVGNKQIKPVYSYSFGVKGLYGGVSLDGDILIVRSKCNKKFYGNKYDIKNILNGNVNMPNNNEYYNKIITYLRDYCSIKDDIGYDGDKDIEHNSQPTSPNNTSLSDIVLNTMPFDEIKNDINVNNNNTNINNETDIKDTNNINENDNDSSINEPNKPNNDGNENINDSQKLSIIEQHKINMKLQREMELQNEMFFDDDTDAFGFAQNNL